MLLILIIQQWPHLHHLRSVPHTSDFHRCSRVLSLRMLLCLWLDNWYMGLSVHIGTCQLESNKWRQRKKILSSSKAMLYVQIWILKKMLRFFPETYNGTLRHSVSSKIRSLVHHKGSRKMTVTLLIPQLFFQLAILPFSLQCESVVISFLTTSFCRKPQGLQIYMLLFLKHWKRIQGEDNKACSSSELLFILKAFKCSVLRWSLRSL